DPGSKCGRARCPGGPPKNRHRGVVAPTMSILAWRPNGRPYPARVSERREKQKVLCYIVRDGRLLVFRHLDEHWDESGLQVPAGGIAPGESPDAAALREAREETGLSEFRLIRKVGETTYDMAPYRPELQHRHVFHL